MKKIALILYSVLVPVLSFAALPGNDQGNPGLEPGIQTQVTSATGTSPIGDLILPIAVMVGLYAAYVVYQKKVIGNR